MARRARGAEAGPKGLKLLERGACRAGQLVPAGLPYMRIPIPSKATSGCLAVPSATSTVIADYRSSGIGSYVDGYLRDKLGSWAC